ncbi:hypothetical protein Scep_024615 [Stephania cephalantha]|uniref:Uncharacterized protein n=1 Tax=Stephania cephalantha TaxID=152367 RepID=A0AAP0EWW1_9MAGN
MMIMHERQSISGAVFNTNYIGQSMLKYYWAPFTFRSSFLHLQDSNSRSCLKEHESVTTRTN